MPFPFGESRRDATAKAARSQSSLFAVAICSLTPDHPAAPLSHLSTPTPRPHAAAAAKDAAEVFWSRNTRISPKPKRLMTIARLFHPDYRVVSGLTIFASAGSAPDAAPLQPDARAPNISHAVCPPPPAYSSRELARRP